MCNMRCRTGFNCLECAHGGAYAMLFNGELMHACKSFTTVTHAVLTCCQHKDTHSTQATTTCLETVCSLCLDACDRYMYVRVTCACARLCAVQHSVYAAPASRGSTHGGD